MTTDSSLRRWAAQWERGWSYRRIGATSGVSESTVRRALRGRVSPRPSGPRARPRPADSVVVTTFEQLQSIRATAADLGVSETFVRARLFAAGLIDRHPDQRPRKT